MKKVYEADPKVTGTDKIRISLYRDPFLRGIYQGRAARQERGYVIDVIIEGRTFRNPEFPGIFHSFAEMKEKLYASGDGGRFVADVLLSSAPLTELYARDAAWLALRRYSPETLRLEEELKAVVSENIELEDALEKALQENVRLESEASRLAALSQSLQTDLEQSRRYVKELEKALSRQPERVTARVRNYGLSGLFYRGDEAELSREELYALWCTVPTLRLRASTVSRDKKYRRHGTHHMPRGFEEFVEKLADIDFVNHAGDVRLAKTCHKEPVRIDTKENLIVTYESGSAVDFLVQTTAKDETQLWYASQLIKAIMFKDRIKVPKKKAASANP